MQINRITTSIEKQSETAVPLTSNSPTVSLIRSKRLPYTQQPAYVLGTSAPT